ncbi:hypothetical protein IAT38_005224 [Cryptococcus sp. DSM 104549]
MITPDLHRAPPPHSLPSKLRTHFRRDSRTFDTPDSSGPPTRRSSQDNVPVIKEGEEEWGGGNLGYRKGEEETPLEARIDRVFYINLYGQEIYPDPNPDYLEALTQRDILVYSCGSMWTSIIPCLALKGLAASIASSSTLRAKVLLLNSTNDRETPGYTASEYITTIVAMLRHYDKPKRNRPNNQPLVGPTWKAVDLVSHVVYLGGGKVEVDEGKIKELGVKMVQVPPEVHGTKEGDTPLFTQEAVEWAMDRVVDDLRGRF